MLPYLRPINAVVMPLRPESRKIGILPSRPKVLLILNALDRSASCLVLTPLLKSLFGLTEAEAHLARREPNGRPNWFACWSFCQAARRGIKTSRKKCGIAQMGHAQQFIAPYDAGQIPHLWNYWPGRAFVIVFYRVDRCYNAPLIRQWRIPLGWLSKTFSIPH